MKIAIVVSKFHKDISERLAAGALEAFAEKKIAKNSIDIFEVPGAFEIPAFIQKLADGKTYDGFIALGAVLEGETFHFRAICDGVAYGIQKVSIENRVPVMFGVLMCHTKEQADARSNENWNDNKGHQCAKSLMELLGEV